MSEGLISPRSRGAEGLASPGGKGSKEKKKKMKETIKGVFKTERKKKDKSKKNTTKNVFMLKEFLEQNSLGLEGLMRVSGNQNEVKKLKALLDSGEPVNLKDYPDQHVISGAFKLLFREMEEPLLTFDLYKNFLAAGDLKDAHAKTSFLKALLITLPPFNSELFNMLLLFLYTIQCNSSVNKMTSENLAIVFAPTILRPREETVDTMMGDAAAATSVVKFMIDNCKALYPETQNLPIISTIVSEEAKAKANAPADPLKMMEETMEKLNAALQSQADEARERAVWESYAQSLQLKLDQSDEALKVIKEERDGLLEVVKDIRQSKTALEEQLAKLQEQVEALPKLQAEVASLKVERDTAVEDKFKQLSELGVTNSDSQKQIAALQEEIAKMRAHHDSEKKTLENQVSKLQKEKTESDNKNATTIKSLKVDKEKLEQSLAAQAPEIEKLKTQLKHAGVKEQELAKQVEGLKTQHNKAVKDLDAKSQEATKLKREKTEAEEKVQRQTKTQQEEKKKLENESASKDSKIAELQKQVNDLQKQVDTLTAENTKLVKKSSEAPPPPSMTMAPPPPSTAASQVNISKNPELEALKKQLEAEKKILENEKKARQEAQKALEAKTEELEKLKKGKSSVDEAESNNSGKKKWSVATPGSSNNNNNKAGSKPAAAATTPSKTAGGLSVEEDLKQHLFTWLTLALKFDRMAMRRICNINASILYEKIETEKVHYSDWPAFIRAEMDKCTVDM